MQSMYQMNARYNCPEDKRYYQYTCIDEAVEKIFMVV